MEYVTASKKATIEKYISAYNAFDIEGMLSFVHRDVEFKNVSGGGVNAEAYGIDEFRKLAEQSKQIFSSRNQIINFFEEEGDIVKVAIRFEAILAADLPRGGKVGDSLNLEGKSVFEFRDGKLWRITDYS